MYLSKHFTLKEFTDSDYALRHGLNNEPTSEALLNLERLAEFLETVRTVIGSPIVISSGYRSPKVNKGVKGSKHSQHCFGCAADIKVGGMNADQIVKKIMASGIQYDQIIREYDAWCHISIPNAPTDKPRKKVLIIDDMGTRLYS
jgi:uncharacterized protein YcbK (DUF882 family)